MLIWINDLVNIGRDILINTNYRRYCTQFLQKENIGVEVKSWKGASGTATQSSEADLLGNSTA